MSRAPVERQDQADPPHPEVPFTARPRPDSAERAERAFIRRGIGGHEPRFTDATIAHRAARETYIDLNFDPDGPYGNRWN